MFFGKLIIFFPLMLVMFLDVAFTLASQPSCYWEDYQACHEDSPVGRILLSMGPQIFLVSFGVYTLAIYVLIKKLQKPFDNMMTITLFLGHARGSSSWLGSLFSELLSVELDEWYLRIFYFMLVATICVICSWNIGKHPARGK